MDDDGHRTPIPFNRPSCLGNEYRFIDEAVRAGQLSGDGRFTRLCNQRIEEITGAQVAMLTHSCTAALEMAAILCGLRAGDEVIMPSFTFVSTANAVVLRGAVPVFVDIDPKTLNLDPERVRDAITPRTKAIFAVHYAGFPADMDALASIAKAHDLILVEDAAQALGSKYAGRPCGSLGDMAAFSFHETKNIISGEGGALTINRPDLVRRAEIIREKGTDRSQFRRGEVDKYTWVDIGSSFLPGELVAAFLYAQLEASDRILARRFATFNRYMQGFAAMAREGRLELPWIPPKASGNGHMFYLLLHNEAERDGFIAHMRSREITCPFHYIPLHSSPGGRAFGRPHGDVGVTDSVSARLVRLPMYFELGSRNVETVIEAAKEYFQPRSKRRSA